MSEADTLTIATLRRALDALGTIPPPPIIVRHPYQPRGGPWMIRDGGRDHYFINPDDIDALPLAPKTDSPLLGGIPVREFDAEMRAVFLRGLERLAAMEPAISEPLPSPPQVDS